MLEALDLPYVQRGLAEIAILSIGAGLIGTWIVLRGLAFYSHAVGTAAFPGLVLADGVGFAAAIGAFGAALVFAGALALLPRRLGDDRGAETALVLVGMLALGVILASDVFGSSAAIESLLFGSLFLIDGGDVALAAAVSATALAAGFTLGPRWVAAGFDGPGEQHGPRRRHLDDALLVLIALATAAAVSAIGALLVAALFVIPAATTRLWFSRVGSWQLATVGLCAATGFGGVLLSVELNTPPGATIAVLAGLFFACSAILARIRRSSGSGPGRLRWAGTLALAALGLAGCGGESGSGASEETVVATTPVVADIASNAAGEENEVVTLLDANTDPHDYEPRPDDIQALAEAELVIASGGDLDEWISDAIDDSGSGAELMVLTEEMPHRVYGEHSGDAHAEESEEQADGGAEELDPHWWHDPRNAVAAAESIAAKLGTDASPFTQRITDLDREIERCVGEVPPGERKIVTDHDAFGYLAERYGIEIVGAVIPALTTEAQPSAGELAALRETIEREDVSAVFPESSVSSDLAETIAEETGATADYELYGDSLGPSGSPGESYLGMLQANADSLIRGMTGGAQGCEAGA